jgi:hypothetical protein
MVPNMKETGI